MALTEVELRMAADLLAGLDAVPARMADTGRTPFILNTGTWVYVEYSEEAHRHVVVNPE